MFALIKSIINIFARRTIEIIENFCAFYKKIFIFQGIIIAIKGVLFGTFIGCLICYLQDTFGLISINMSSSIVENYPVKIIYNDVLLVALIVIFISSIASIIPANYASKYENFLNLNKK